MGNYYGTDFLHTRYGEFLNQNSQGTDLNDDIFGLLSNYVDTVGVISAGDNKILVNKNLELLYHFQPDVIVCAARTRKEENAPDFEEIKEFFNSFNTEFLDAVTKTEENKLAPLDNLFEEIKIKKDMNIIIPDDTKTIENVYQKIKSVLRGFSI
mgnify:CR=1 FL=1